MEIVRLDACTEYWWPLLFCPGSSFRSLLSLGGGTGNGPMISLRPSLITEHHSVSSQSDPAREASPCSRYLRPARDVDTTCTVEADVYESVATKVRAHRAPNLLRECLGRSDRRARCSDLSQAKVDGGTARTIPELPRSFVRTRDRRKRSLRNRPRAARAADSA